MGFLGFGVSCLGFWEFGGVCGIRLIRGCLVFFASAGGTPLYPPPRGGGKWVGRAPYVFRQRGRPPLSFGYFPRERGKPWSCVHPWVPAFAGMTGVIAAMTGEYWE